MMSKQERRGEPVQTKIAVEGLSLWYGNGAHQALEEITMHFAAGEITALIGPSGCGKSSLLLCLNRLWTLVEGCRAEGKVLLDSEPVDELADNVLRRRVGMVFQKPSPFPMSIYDNVAYGREPTVSAAARCWTKRWNRPCAGRRCGMR